VLGKGLFGTVYLGESQEHGRVAIKVMPVDADSDELAKLALEADIMRAMNKEVAEGFPRLYWQGRQTIFGQECEILVMELLGSQIDKRCQTNKPDSAEPDWFCDCTSLSGATVQRIGRELLRALRVLHRAGYMHNDLKPSNVVFGAKDSGREDHVYLIDYGSATKPGQLRASEKERYGGGTPLFASLAEHQGRPTRPIDDIESLWYSLAFLAHGSELPWKWEDPELTAEIKRQMTVDGCAISEDEGEGNSQACDIHGSCKTQHCKDQVDHWLDGDLLSEANEALQELWEEILAHNEEDPDKEVDYTAMIQALGGMEGYGGEVKMGGLIPEKEEKVTA